MRDTTSLFLVSLPLGGFCYGGWDLAFIGASCAAVLYFSFRLMASQHYRPQLMGWCAAVGGVGGAVFGGGVEYGILGLVVAQLALWLIAQVTWYLGEDGIGGI